MLNFVDFVINDLQKIHTIKTKTFRTMRIFILSKIKLDQIDAWKNFQTSLTHNKTDLIHSFKIISLISLFFCYTMKNLNKIVSIFTNAMIQCINLIAKTSKKIFCIKNILARIFRKYWGILSIWTAYGVWSNQELISEV